MCKNIKHTVECPNCNELVVVSKKKLNKQGQKFCSKNCWVEFSKKPNINCNTCGVIFRKKPAQIERSDTHFCSKKCYNKYRYAWTTVQCYVCEKDIDRLKTIVECRDKNFCSNRCFSEFNVNENNGNWKNGSSYGIKARNDIRQWSLKVKEIANHTCEKCGDTESPMNSHHIYSYTRCPKLRKDLDNGACLCESCHKEFHTLYGIKSFTPEEYFKWIIKKINHGEKIL